MEEALCGYKIRHHNIPVKRYCQTLDLINSPELIAEYRKAHSKTEMWTEILEGIKAVGILEMEIYILDTHLFMIIETPLDFDWNIAMKKLIDLPRQQEWEDRNCKFQMAKAGDASTEKWKIMERMFYLYNK